MKNKKISILIITYHWITYCCCNSIPYVCCPTHTHLYIYILIIYINQLFGYLWLVWIVVISGDFVQLSGCLYIHFIPRPSGSPRLSFCEHWRHAAAAGAWLGLTPNMGIGSLGSCDTQFLGLNNQLPTISRLYLYIYCIYIDICMDILTSIFWSENMCARLWSMTKWRLHMRYSRENCMLHVHIYILKYYILFILYTLYIHYIYIIYYIIYYIYVNIYIYLWSVFWSAWPCNCGHLLATVHTKLSPLVGWTTKTTSDHWSNVVHAIRSHSQFNMF